MSADDETTSVTYYVKFYPISGETRDSPRGLVRRRYLRGGGIVDEALRPDLRWHHSSAIVETEFKGTVEFELEEISQERAAEVIEMLRTKWAALPDNQT
jgi:hypothetical protein